MRESVGKLVDKVEPDDLLILDLECLHVAWDVLELSSNDRKCTLEEGLDKARRYKRLGNDTNDWLTDTEAELEKRSGVVPLQRDALNDEIAFCEAFREKVEAKKHVLDDVHRAADDLTSPRPEDDSERRDVNSQVKELDERYHKLSAGIGVRLATLQAEQVRREHQRELDECERRCAERVQTLEREIRAERESWIMQAQKQAKEKEEELEIAKEKLKEADMVHL